MTYDILSPLLFLLIILIIPNTQASNSESSIISYRDLLAEHLIDFTNIPRIFFKIERDYNDQIYKIKLNVRRNKAIPLHILPYTPETWISAMYVQDLNVLPMVCDFVNNCVYDTAVEDSEVFYLNYSLKGTDGQLRLKGAMEAYTNPMNFTLIRAEDWEGRNFTHKMDPFTEPVSGGLGLGYGYNGTRTFFLRSFTGLVKPVASIFLSANEFDISSEMLIGDINSAHIQLDTKKIIANVTNFDSWAFNFSKITDNDGNSLYQKELDLIVILDPNLPYLGVPEEAYDGFISALENKFGIKCGRELTMPNCTYPKDTQFKNLYFSKGDTKLFFPESLYVKTNDTYCTLMIGNTSNISVISDFKSYWIFGGPFMTYYYTVLNFTNETALEIDFFRAKTFKKTSKFYWIIGSISAFVAIGSLCALYMLVRKDRADKCEKEESTMLEEQLVDQSGINEEMRRGTIDLYARDSKIRRETIDLDSGDSKMRRETIDLDHEANKTESLRRDTFTLSAVQEDPNDNSEFLEQGEGETQKGKRGDSLLQF